MMPLVQQNNNFCGWNTEKSVALMQTLDQVSGVALPWTCNVFFGQPQIEESGKEGAPKHWISEDVLPLCELPGTPWTTLSYDIMSSINSWQQ